MVVITVVKTSPALRRVEAEFGPIKDYFRGAARRGIGTRKMALEIGVHRHTIRAWLKAFGFRPKTTTTYVEDII